AGELPLAAAPALRRPVRRLQHAAGRPSLRRNSKAVRERRARIRRFLESAESREAASSDVPSARAGGRRDALLLRLRFRHRGPRSAAEERPRRRIDAGLRPSAAHRGDRISALSASTRLRFTPKSLRPRRDAERTWNTRAFSSNRSSRSSTKPRSLL